MVRHIRSRRRDLRGAIGYGDAFELWEETCVPSYCHRNPLAAGISWLRLFAAVDLARRTVPSVRRVLDFGSSVGELGHIIGDHGPRYDFVEQNEQAATFLQSRLPEANRVSLALAPSASYNWIFAIDALEHNDDFAALLGELAAKLTEGGALVLSGPTENAIYRFGRRVAGFRGGYHRTTIHEIEEAATAYLRRIHHRVILPGLPLFRVSVWMR